VADALKNLNARKASLVLSRVWEAVLPGLPKSGLLLTVADTNR